MTLCFDFDNQQQRPTVLRIGAYRLFFFAGDRQEPPHIHIERDDNLAKFWLDPVRLQNSGGFSRNEIARIQRVIIENQKLLLESWNVYFNDRIHSTNSIECIHYI